MEVAASDPGQQPRFSAFLSYSHADAAAVRKLHAQLESYRLPKELGEVAALNQIDRRLGRVFRDREDLSAAESLSDAVTAALDQSEVLVVVCSPEAKASRWVNQEITYFRANRPGKPILAAVVRGEPSEAFPDALTQGGAEPLAADLRKQGDGWKLGFLKVVSGIAGVPLDALVQRDSQRQTRRVMAVTGVSVLAALVMAIMTTVAIQSRNEAQIQQAEAERQRDNTDSFNAYFISDFRDQMLAIGKLDIALDFYDRVLTYCQERHASEDTTNPDNSDCARLVEIAGMDHERAGNFDKARLHYREAWRITGQQLEHQKGQPERVLAHAISENRLGSIETRLNNEELALQHFEAARCLAESIAEWGQSNDDWRREMAYIGANQAAFFIRQGNYPENAQRHIEQAVELNRRSIQQKPEAIGARYDLAFHLSWMAEGEALAQRLEVSDDLFAEALTLSTKLVAENPADSWLAEQKVELLLKEARVLLASKRGPSRRLENLREASSIVEELLEIEPKTEKWPRLRSDIERLKS